MESPSRVAELASREVGDAYRSLALDRARELGAAVREYLALPSEAQRYRRVRARVDDGICARDMGEMNARRDELCAAVRASTTAEAALEAFGSGAARAQQERTLAPTEAQCRKAASADAERERPVRDLRALLALGGDRGQDVPLERVQSFVASLDRRQRAATLGRMLEAPSEAVRAVAADEAGKDGRTKEAEAVWRSLRSGRSPATAWLALARARRGEKEAMDVLADALAHAEPFAGEWSGLRLEALVLLTNSAARAGVVPCLRATTTGPCEGIDRSGDNAPLGRWWRENRDRVVLYDAWPGLADVPYWVY